MAAASKGESRYPPPVPPSLPGCSWCRCLPAACSLRGGDTEKAAALPAPHRPDKAPGALCALLSSWPCPRSPRPPPAVQPCPCCWHSPPGGTAPGPLRHVLSSPAALPVPWPRCQGQAARRLLALAAGAAPVLPALATGGQRGPSDKRWHLQPGEPSAGAGCQHADPQGGARRPSCRCGGARCSPRPPEIKQNSPGGVSPCPRLTHGVAAWVCAGCPTGLHP